ncbi:MAG: cysteine desulfurase family protein [Bacteriovoracaceae bacterium]
MKLINRLYFDFNANSPLANSVKEILARGDFYFNPSSTHSTGKKSKKEILLATEKIKNIFHTQYFPLFHSGATEGINLVLQGRVKKLTEEGKKPFLIAMSTDHSAVLATIKGLSAYPFQILPVLPNGLCDLEVLDDFLRQNSGFHFVLNLTWVNNESGVVQDLHQIKDICDKYPVYIHVDGAQAPNKINGWDQLPEGIDAFTFSAHKFGGLMGVGLTFLKNKNSLLPLIYGGGQQDGLRGGTENVLGVVTMASALEEIYSYKDSLTDLPKKLIETHLLSSLSDKIIIVGFNAPRNVNTMDLIWKSGPSDQTLIHFDLAGMDISAGSACSSGRLKDSHVLDAMGFHHEKGHGLRFSFSPQMNQEQAEKYAHQILSVFQSL